MISHTWLLLSDSALPLGSFAFSSSLESHLAHHPKPLPPAPLLLSTFLQRSLLSTASTTLPFLLAAHNDPVSAATLDDALDASTPCTVARRASTSQGRALLAVWTKSLSPSITQEEEDGGWVEDYKAAIRAGEAHGHFGVAWGLVCRAAGLTLEDTCYVFVFNHVKAVLSAAVRLGVVGPYQAQAMLALEETRKGMERAVREGMERNVEDAGQTVPVLDLVQGRHELLYSRVFNS